MNNNTDSINITSGMLEKMEKEIFSVKPQIKKIKDTYGHLSYYDYIKQKTRVNLHKNFGERKHEVVGAIVAETSRLLGSNIASEVERQLKKNDSVSTAEHSGPIGTSNMLNATLSHSIPAFNNPDPRFRNIIVLSCTGISFGNASSYTRGYQLHQFVNNEVLENTLTFFGRSMDALTVMFAKPYTIDTVREMKKKVESFIQAKQNSPEDKDKLFYLLDKIYSSPHALSGSDYVDQLSITNYYFWKTLFPAYKESQIPNYIMLSQEKVIMSLLLNNHLDNKTPIHNFLFDPKYLDLIEKHFADVTGAFSKDHTTGSFLFWGVSKKDGMRFQLIREGNTLVNKDYDYSLPLTPKHIRNAINSKQIYPGLLLTFVILAFYYGLIPEGGHLQTTYLTQMKEKYIALMKEAGDLESANDAENSITEDYLVYRPHLAFLDAWGERVAATGLDMYLYQDPSCWKNVIEATKGITFDEIITILMPVFYKQITPTEKRNENLMNVMRNEVEKFIGYDKKLPPIGHIS